jgi:hypothetical protein
MGEKSMMTRNERKELNALSLEVFGSSSRWQKFVTKGHPEMISEEKEEIVPPEHEGESSTTRKVQVPIKTDFGAVQFTTKHYTVEGIRKLMIEQKAALAELKIRVQKYQEEVAAARAAEDKARELHETSAGSAK